MSRLEKAWWVLRIAVSLLVVFLFRHHSQGWALAVVGIVTFVVFPYVLDGLAGLEVLLIGKPRGKPPCSCRCSGKALEWEFLYSKGKELAFRCECGKVYIDYNDRFMCLERDGIAIPYMKFINRRKGWMPDSGPAINMQDMGLNETPMQK